MNLNQCNFIGRLGADPEIRYMPNGDMVLNNIYKSNSYDYFGVNMAEIVSPNRVSCASHVGSRTPKVVSNYSTRFMGCP